MPSEDRSRRVVKRLLEQHAWLRTLLQGLDAAAADVVARGQPGIPALTLALAQLREALDEHGKAEELGLRDILTAAGGWHAERVEHMLVHHAEEHTAMRHELHVVSQERSPALAASRARIVCEALRAHMAAEEREVLRTHLGRDDAGVLDAS